MAIDGMAWLWIKILVSWWTFSTSRLLNGLLNVHPPHFSNDKVRKWWLVSLRIVQGDDLGVAQVGNGPAIPCFWLVLISMIGCRYPLLGLVIFIAGTIHIIYIYIWHVEWLYHLISPVVLLFLLRILWITSSYAWNHWFPRWNQRLSAPSKYTELGYQKVVLGLIVLPCYPHELYQSHELSHVLGETIMFFAGWIPKNCWVNFLCCLIQSLILGETIFLGVSPQ